MKKPTRKYCAAIYLLAGYIFLASSCSNTKYLPAGDALYTGAKITIEDKTVSKKKKKAVRKQLAQLPRPKPNSKILGMRIKLYAYNIAGHPKREGSLRGWLKYKVGEPPALLSDLDLDKNIQVLKSYLENKGYFRAEVTGDTTVKKRRATATYKVTTGPQYTIDSIIFPHDSSSALITAINNTEASSLFKRKDPFDLDIIKAERQRINDSLQEHGFYFFNDDYLLIKTDSTIGNNKVNMYVTAKTDMPGQAREVYRINDIYIFTSFNLNTAATDTIKASATYYKGYYLVDKRKNYKPQLFSQTMQFNPGDIYTRTDHTATLSRLINLNLFKFVKNRFEVAPGTDSAKLNTFYYLTRLPKKSLRVEINASTKSNNLTGSQVTIGWRNRNTFRAGELLSINATGGFEVQYSGQFRGYNTYRGGLETSLAFPRFLIPFIFIEGRGGFVPRTTVKLSYDILNKRKLYTMNSFGAQFGYNWKENIRKEHELNPISITYVNPIAVTQRYADSAKNNTTLQKAIEKQFILGSTYRYTYTNMVNNKPANGIYFSGGLDLSGNIAGLITGANIKKMDTAKIFHAAFSQYVKIESDFRFYRKLSEKSAWANHILIGFGLPNGNSRELPFIKQFFSGGNNSIRAFRSRSLGPGTYYDTTNTFFADQSGDIKLELSSELRLHLFSVVNAGLFIDAGNIWLYNENPDKVGAKFSKNFLHELAVGTGVGLRLDFSLLILRLDVAFPLRKPWLPEGQRWVASKIDLSNSTWRKENLVFNLAIGYPF
jgi:outer membrane protein insertion porin family